MEAEILTGIKVDSEEAADKAADWFFSKGVKECIDYTGAARRIYKHGREKGNHSGL